jgi:hypothetical protein
MSFCRYFNRELYACTWKLLIKNHIHFELLKMKQNRIINHSEKAHCWILIEKKIEICYSDKKKSIHATFQWLRTIITLIWTPFNRQLMKLIIHCPCIPYFLMNQPKQHTHPMTVTTMCLYPRPRATTVTCGHDTSNIDHDYVRLRPHGCNIGHDYVYPRPCGCTWPMLGVCGRGRT